MNDLLVVDSTVENGCTRITASGEIDLASVAPLRRSLLDALITGRPIALDLSEVAFIDSTGLHLLLDTAERAKTQGQTLLINAASPQVQRTFEIAGHPEWCRTPLTRLENRAL